MRKKRDNVIFVNFKAPRRKRRKDPVEDLSYPNNLNYTYDYITPWFVRLVALLVFMTLVVLVL